MPPYRQAMQGDTGCPPHGCVAGRSPAAPHNPPGGPMHDHLERLAEVPGAPPEEQAGIQGESPGRFADLEAVDSAWNDVHTTLRILGELRQEEVGRWTASLEQRVDEVLRPLVRSLRTEPLSGHQRALVEVLGRTLGVLREPLPIVPGEGPGLSRREMMVANLMRIALSDQAAAAILGISPRTVASHRRRIRAKVDQGPAGRPGSAALPPGGRIQRLADGDRVGGPCCAPNTGFGRCQRTLESRCRQLLEMHRRLKGILRSQRRDRDRELGIVVENLKYVLLPLIDRLAVSTPETGSNCLVRDLRQRVAELVQAFRLPLGARVYRLTACEARVARAIRRGDSTRDIAGVLGISPRTVEVHRLSIRRKLGASKRGVNLRSLLLTLGDDAEGPPARRLCGWLSGGGGSAPGA
jgi:DNA-binding CsgD family transcriptional regulator